MKIKQTALATALSILGLNASSASAFENGLLILKMSGGRGWTMSCVFDREDGSSMEKSARGRGRVETFAVRDVTAGACDYAGPRRGELRIRFQDENNPENCPLTVVSGECLRIVGSDRSGGFSF